MAPSQTDPYDVAIIGLGPVGATLAGLLATYGLRVLAMDKAPGIYDLPRALGMDHEAMRIFQQLGIAEALTPYISAYRPSEYRTETGEVIRRFDSSPEPHQLGWPPYLTFLQPELERVLRERIAEDPAVDKRTGVELIGLTDEGDQTTLTLRDTDGTERTATARFVVGCDGGNSFVRKSLGIPLEDLGFDEPWLVVDMLVEETRALPEVNIQYCHPARPHTYVVGPGTFRRWEFMLMPGETPEEMVAEDRIWSLLAPWLSRSEARIWRAATYRFHALVAETWRSGNILLAGDACHMTPPFLAQGMVQGIKDTANLAWKLAAVVKGASPDLLETYTQERRPLVRQVISITKDLGRVICETDPEKAETRNARMRTDMAEGRGVSIRQDLFPPLAQSPLCNGDTPGVGRPAPQPRVLSDGEWTLLDEVTGHRFALLTCPGFALSDTDAEKAKALGLRVFAIGEDLPEQDGVFASWMSERDASAILVRPDHMVMAVLSSPDQLERVLSALAPFLRT